MLLTLNYVMYIVVSRLIRVTTTRRMVMMLITRFLRYFMSNLTVTYPMTFVISLIMLCIVTLIVTGRRISMDLNTLTRVLNRYRN